MDESALERYFDDSIANVSRHLFEFAVKEGIVYIDC